MKMKIKFTCLFQNTHLDVTLDSSTTSISDLVKVILSFSIICNFRSRSITTIKRSTLVFRSYDFRILIFLGFNSKSTIDADINKMHYSSSIEEFEYMKTQALLRWNSFPELNDFVIYFTGQWLNSQWINWKLFTRPVGFSTTNNNTEGFNRIIKLIYTSYERNNVLNCCQMIVKMVTDLSKSQNSFELKLKRDNDLIKEASQIKIHDFQMLTPNSANWLFNGQPSYLVYSEPKYCSCKTFLEYGICRHFIALCKLTNKEFDEVDREFVQLKKRGRPAKSNNGALNKN